MAAKPQKVENAGLGDGTLYLFDTVESTNDWAMKHLDSLEVGDVVCALEQIRGKGRRGRQWMTPRGGLAMSLVLAYPEDEMKAPMLGMVAALGVASWIEEEGLPALIKWPNDVLVNHRKISGILSEARPATGKAVVGIGLNVNVTEQEALQFKARWPATSLSIEADETWNLEEVRSGLLGHLEQIINTFQSEGFSALKDRWEELDGLAEMNIVVDTGEARLEGQYDGIDENGQLCIIRGKKTPPISVGDVVAIYKKSG